MNKVNMLMSKRMCYNDSMSKILIIGNILKDIYIKLDERDGDFEVDEKDVSWLNLAFNGGEHHFFKRSSIYGGAAVSLGVLSKLGIQAKILGSQTEFKGGELLRADAPDDYRYILCYKEEITYFVPSERKPTDWSTPSDTPEWVFLDRSANVTAKLVEEVANFLKFAKGTKLAVHLSAVRTPEEQRLVNLADIVFREEEPSREAKFYAQKVSEPAKAGQIICYLTDNLIQFGEVEERWSRPRTDMMTHLTVYSTIASTILGVISAGGTAQDAVLWAKANAEQATLEGSLGGTKLEELAQIERDKRANLRLIAESLMSFGEGVLALDESPKSIERKFAQYNLKNSWEMRRDYRFLFCSTPNLDQYISGVILADETTKQKVNAGADFVQYLTSRKIVPGVKVDQGLTKLPHSDEDYTLGLDGLDQRLREYYRHGLRFAKWRARFEIGQDKPGIIAIDRNCEALAAFAKECQLAGLVPMVEAEVVRDGEHKIEECLGVTHKILGKLFEEMEKRKVDLSGCVLKTNMITSGKEAEFGATPDEVGMATAAILQNVVPRNIGGVLLLSGGQTTEEALRNLKAVIERGPFSWPVSFAFARAFQDPVIKIWQGQKEQSKLAQEAFVRRLESAHEIEKRLQVAVMKFA